VNEYLITLKHDLIEEMSYQHATDGVYESTWKQTMTAFWDMFEHGTSVVTVRCECGNTSPTEDSFATLFLGFENKFHSSIEKRKNHCALSDMISHYQNESQADWACTFCNAREKNAIRDCRVTQYPKILYIVLQRGTYNEELITTPVDFPVENFYPYKSSRRIDSTNCDVRYDLVTSIYRQSTTQHKGHFFAVCKDDSSGVWHEYDDHEISLTSLQKKTRMVLQYMYNISAL